MRGRIILKNLNLKINLPFNCSLSIWFQKIDKVLGINSRINKKDDDSHILLWDFDDEKLNDVYNSLLKVQKKYVLSNIYIVGGDKDKSFKALCFDRFTFWDMIGILYNTERIDKSFYRWSVRKGQSTMRISKKNGRPDLNVINCIYSNRMQPEIPDILNFVKYETPIGEYIKNVN